MRILNLYAGIGGNRMLWDGHDITAVELDPGIASVYKLRFPDDDVVVGDAHQYLLEHYHEFDFIWSSPPCVTHTKLIYANNSLDSRKHRRKYPDLALYAEVIFLDRFHKGAWVVENVYPYYEPLVKPRARIGRHLYWTNLPLAPYSKQPEGIKSKRASVLAGRYGGAALIGMLRDAGFDSSKTRQIIRNCVDPDVALEVLRCAEGYQHEPAGQMVLPLEGV